MAFPAQFIRPPIPLGSGNQEKTEILLDTLLPTFLSFGGKHIQIRVLACCFSRARKDWKRKKRECLGKKAWALNIYLWLFFQSNRGDPFAFYSLFSPVSTHC